MIFRYKIIALMEMMLTSMIELLKDIAPFICCVGCFFIFYEVFYRINKNASALFNGILSSIVTITLYFCAIFYFKLRRLDYFLDAFYVFKDMFLMLASKHASIFGGILTNPVSIVLIFECLLSHSSLLYFSAIYGNDLLTLFALYVEELEDSFKKRLANIKVELFAGFDKLFSTLSFSKNNQKAYIINSSFAC